jgi:hypothetical protein
MDIKIDAKRLKVRTRQEEARLVKSVVKASNDTALDVQVEERVNLDRKFTLRRAGFMYRLVKIKFASVKKGIAFAEVFLDQTKKRILLNWFEDGGEKTPTKGKNVAVPVTQSPARPSFGDPVQQAFEYKHLNLKEVIAETGTKQLKGNKRTFYLPKSRKAPEGGVFMRVGKAKDAIVQLYEMVHRPKLKERLGFKLLARKVWNERWEQNFNRAWRKNSKMVK